MLLCYSGVVYILYHPNKHETKTCLLLFFETGNTSETRQMVTKIDATAKILKFSSNGELTSETNSNYEDTDYSSPDLTVRMIIRTVGE